MDNDLKIKIKVDSNTGELIVTRKEFDKLGKTVNNTKKNTDSFSKSMKTIASTVAGLYLVNKAFGMIANTTKQFIGTAMEFERYSTILTTLEGSSTKAAQSMNWITDFAKKTPYELANVTDSFVKLRSYGINPTNGTLKVLGDTAAAMGKPLVQAVEAMADAVTGENERLKEFGITSKKLGEEIRYNWTNSSGQARTILIENNSAIIKSTLTAIWNSSYQGAADAQANTLKGMISNIKGEFTVFQNTIMNAGVFNYIKAMTETVGNYLKESFKVGSLGAESFANNTIDAINSVIKGFGTMYDVMNGIGLVMDGFKISFGFFLLPIEKAVNLGITAVNLYRDLMGSGEQISSVSFASELMASGISSGMENWQQIGTGGELADKFIADIQSSFEKIEFNPETIIEKKDFGNAVVPTVKDDYTWSQSNETNSIIDAINQGNLTKDELLGIKEYSNGNSAITDLIDYYLPSDDYQEQLEITQDTLNTTTDTVEQTQSVFDNLNETLYSDSSSVDDVYSVVNNVNDSFDDMTTAVNNVDYGVKKSIVALDKFIFKFEDVFMNSITTNAQELYNIGSQKTGFTDISYQDALTKASNVRDNLISNPLDIEIGKEYETAFNQLLDSANNYLVADNFNSSSDFKFAQNTVNSQVEQFQQTALAGYSTLDSMNDFLGSINKAFEDGILSDEEKKTISDVADNVNAKNEILLNSDSSIVGATLGISTTVGNQTYYDNTGLATDTNVSAQTYYDNSGLMKDKTFGLVDVSSLAISADLIGTNSVSDYVKKLMGSGTSGISLTSIASGMTSLGVATGLDVGDLSNLAIGTDGKIDIKASTHLAVADKETHTMASGKTLGNLQVSSVDSYDYYTNSWYNNHQSVAPSNALKGNKTTYTYHADGGFTGQGLGRPDSTGFKQAGIVHEDEWVSPKWMVEQRPEIFAQLEDIRQKGSFAKGGYTSSNMNMAIQPIDNSFDFSELVEEFKKVTKELAGFRKEQNTNTKNIVKNTTPSRFAS